jgi:hypothetical protein
MKRIATLFILLGSIVFVTACDGPTGPAGPAGPAGPGIRRGAAYCNATSAEANVGNAWTLTASCNTAADIPLHGFCFEPAGLPAGAALVLEAPIAWDVTTGPAGWGCTWGWISGTPTPFTGTAEICCATPE